MENITLVWLWRAALGSRLVLLRELVFWGKGSSQNLCRHIPLGFVYKLLFRPKGELFSSDFEIGCELYNLSFQTPRLVLFQLFFPTLFFLFCYKSDQPWLLLALDTQISPFAIRKAQPSASKFFSFHSDQHTRFFRLAFAILHFSIFADLVFLVSCHCFGFGWESPFHAFLRLAHRKHKIWRLLRFESVAICAVHPRT